MNNNTKMQMSNKDLENISNEIKEKFNFDKVSNSEDGGRSKIQYKILDENKYSIRIRKIDDGSFSDIKNFLNKKLENFGYEIIHFFTNESKTSYNIDRNFIISDKKLII